MWFFKKFSKCPLLWNHMSFSFVYSFAWFSQVSAKCLHNCLTFSQVMAVLRYIFLHLVFSVYRDLCCTQSHFLDLSVGLVRAVIALGVYNEASADWMYQKAHKKIIANLFMRRLNHDILNPWWVKPLYLVLIAAPLNR